MAYKSASTKLHDVIDKLLHEFEDKSRPAKLLKRREDPEPASDSTLVHPDEPAREAFERLYSAYRTGKLLADKLARLRREHTYDPFAPYRTYLFDLLRKDGEEDVFRLDGKPTSRTHHLPLMPLLAGDNPMSNTLTSKFLRLTDYQLYLLRQWARGDFYNEILEDGFPRI